jgi:hypothetical protein
MAFDKEVIAEFRCDAAYSRRRGPFPLLLYMGQALLSRCLHRSFRVGIRMKCFEIGCYRPSQVSWFACCALLLMIAAVLRLIGNNLPRNRGFYWRSWFAKLSCKVNPFQDFCHRRSAGAATRRRVRPMASEMVQFLFEEGVPERRPEKVKSLVYLAAFLLRHGESLLQVAQEDRGSMVLTTW